MIGRITGQVIDHNHQQLLVDVAGVAYEIEVPLTRAYELAKTAGPVVLHTHFVVREDANLLFGFPTKNEREVFRALIRVHNVGPKLALAVLSGLDNDALAQAVQSADVKALKAIPGVGERTAKQIVLDLKDKLPELLKLGVAVAGAGRKIATDPESKIVADAESALLDLGYRPKEAAAALASVRQGAKDVETLLRLALKQLVQK